MDFAVGAEGTEGVETAGTSGAAGSRERWGREPMPVQEPRVAQKALRETQGVLGITGAGAGSGAGTDNAEPEVVDSCIVEEETVWNWSFAPAARL